MLFEDKAVVKWTREASEAWDAIQFLVAEAPLLYSPNRSGRFCVTSDASMFALGGGLYQIQKGEKGDWTWRLIDLFSQIMPSNMRSNHCRFHEAYAAAQLIQHWTVHLIRAPFILATDHKNLIKFFTASYDLSLVQHRQLLRIRLALADYDIIIQHVKGLDTVIADALSRLNLKLIEIYGERKIKISGDYNNHAALSDKDKIELKHLVHQFEIKSRKIKNDIKNINNEINDNHKLYKNVVQLLQIKENYYKNKMNQQIRCLPHNIRIKFNPILCNLSNIPSISELNYRLVDIDTTDNLINICGNLMQCEQGINNYILNEINNVTSNIIINHPIIMPIQTRSMTQSKKCNIKSKKSNVIIDIDAMDIYNRVKLRDKLLNSLYNYRNTDIIFKFKLWPQMQQSDEHIKLLYQYVLDKWVIVNDANLLSAWQDMKKQISSYHNAAMNDELKINDRKILMIKRFNVIKSKYHYVYIVPTCLRGTVKSYGHHSTSNHHYGQIPTLDNVEYYFWWPNIRNDIRDHVNKCIIYQFAKGSPIKKQQMRIRDLPNVREHIMADYMGPFFRRYYILVLH